MVSFYDFETTGTSPVFDQPIKYAAIYRNLHPDIYQTRFNLNDLGDLMKVIHAVWDQAPDTLEWPLDDKDRVSFKPDRLAPANGFTAHNAHLWFSGFCPPCRSARHRVQTNGRYGIGRFEPDGSGTFTDALQAR